MKKKPHKIGDRFTVNGIECVARFVNLGHAYVCPIADHPHDTRIARHIAYARIFPSGQVQLL